MSFEDIGVMRSIPNMVIFEPVDIVQLEKALPKIIDYDGPIYVRFFLGNLLQLYLKRIINSTYLRGI